MLIDGRSCCEITPVREMTSQSPSAAAIESAGSRRFARLGALRRIGRCITHSRPLVHLSDERPKESNVEREGASVTDPADLGVVEAGTLLQRRALSARELAEACLARIRERDGTHSHDGDPSSINAWVRVYEDDALAAADRADARLARGEASPLCGVPIGLKDLYAVAGKPLTASSRLLDEAPARSSDVWSRLCRAGMVLLGHLHTHEFAGGRDDRPGRQSVGARPLGGRLERRLGGGARGADDAGRDGHRHRGLAPDPVGDVRHLDGEADARARADPRHRAAGADARPCGADGAERARLRAAARGDGRRHPAERRPLRRVAVSPRIGELDPDVADGFDAALCELDVVSRRPRRRSSSTSG